MRRIGNQKQSGAWVLWACAFAIIIYFDVMWCMATTFTAMSRPLTWVNALLLSLLVSAPAIVWGKRRLQLCVLGV